MSDPQLIAVWLIVAVAAAYVLRRTLRTWAGGSKKGCGGGCGCTRVVEPTQREPEVIIPTDQLRVRESR